MQSEATIPLFPLGLVLLPQNPLPLHIFEERYKLMIGECLEESKAFGMDFKSLSFLIAGSDGFSAEEKQRFLEMTSTGERFEKGVESLAKIIERVNLTDEIHEIIGGNGNAAGYAKLIRRAD